MTTPTTPPESRLAIVARGVIQGVGFRPFVYRTARAAGLTGWVRNDDHAVNIEVQGSQSALQRFLAQLRRELPPQAQLDALDAAPIPCRAGSSAFEILASDGGAKPRPATPADLALCPDCLAEIRDPRQRRFGYPFTNCTNCGPRWSIIRALPYDRARTSMQAFAMCPACRTEYDDPADRRFHAQPIACPICGPQLRLLDASGAPLAAAGEALIQTVAALRAGQIAAIKGLGGFQLLVDATQPAAVARLRQRKHRPHRPLALMFASLADVERCCQVSPAEAAALGSHQAPIVLLARRPDPLPPTIAAETAPGNPYLGAMLPYTPLHRLLLDAIQTPLVCTSGNLSEEPMAVTDEEAFERLHAIADVLLIHNRPIVRPVDDSVTRVVDEGVQTLRRARGFAPLPLPRPGGGPTLLAVGGHLKNTVALAIDDQVVLSPHIGDLDSVLGVEVHRRAITDLVDFFQVHPNAVVCDLHPDYASTRVAEELAQRWNAPLVRVQHHQAHVAACIAEHGLAGPTLGLAWDGTGYGLDGTIWGGEFLICAGERCVRAAHLRRFPLPGGDRAAREPRRSALGLLYALDPMLATEHCGDLFSSRELAALTTLLGRNAGGALTSSMGRLFDAVAALCGLPAAISFEGQSAMALEFAADASCEESYPLPLRTGPFPDDQPAIADWGPLVQAVLEDRTAGVDRARISARFHNALADLAVAVAQRCACRQVALSGGCFQNALLAARVSTRLRAAGFEVYAQRAVPPGDGGIALGQIWVATQQWRG